MMAHVAEAAEASGRVLVWLDTGHGDIACGAASACRFAEAFNAAIESLSFNADSIARATTLASSVVVRRVHADNRERGLAEVSAVQSIVEARQQRCLEQAAQRHGVPLMHTALDGEAIDRLSEVCASRGPWNIVVLPRAASEETAREISTIFANVSGATGIVAVPPVLASPAGPIAVVVEDAERLPAMLRAASRLKGLCGRVHLVLAADVRRDLAELEAHVRLVTANHIGIEIELSEPVLGVAGALDQPLRALRPSFVIARFGGTLLPTPRAFARTITLSGAPFLLVR